MYRNYFIAIIRRLLGRDRALARCPVISRRRLPVVLLVLLFSAARLVSASILVSGDVTPTDNPFPVPFPNGTNPDEGLPTDGNFVNPFENPDKQTFFEGRHLDNNVADLTDDTNVNIPEIIVGQSAFGTLLISGESALRDQTLTIGGSGPRSVGSTVIRPGTGVVRITGFGSLYNNDPSIIPAGLPINFKSQTPRNPNGGDGLGNDLYVGLAGPTGLGNTAPTPGIPGGNGTLEISAGGRAEIQDAVVVGRNTNSTGSIIVDGFDSFLGSGGFAASGGPSAEPHQMIIGLQGVGYMTITNGATVLADAPSGGGGTGSVGPVGAVIGSGSFDAILGQVPDPGGTGTVAVIGTASKWVVSGSLQIGGFDIGQTGVVVGDPEGDKVEYGSQAGRGNLSVQAGGLVNIVNAIGADVTNPKLLLAIGHFGRVDLNGGQIIIGSVIGQNTTEARANSVQLINDGVITGSGRIETGVFNNRLLGEVRVNAGESLVIDSSADVTGVTASEPLTNFGKIQVLGTFESPAQLEIERAPAAILHPVRPFLNLPLTTPPTPFGFGGGLISAQFATLRFGSGLQNQSKVAFTAGTNYISGRVVNLALDLIDNGDDDDAGDTTQLLVSGPDTTAVFEDDLVFGEGADLRVVDGGTVVVLNQHSFTTAGDISIELSFAHPSLINISGDVGIGPGAGNNDLSLSFASDALQNLKHGDSFQLISFGGDIGNVDLTDPNNPVPDFTAPPLFTDIDTSPDIKALFGLDTVIQFSNEGVYAVFLDPMMVGSGGGAMGPDFNGDGVVNGFDYDIWLANVGIESGASVLQGDADGDGDVDGDDFLFWQRNAGHPMPWTGAGSGSGVNSAVVPEPTVLALLLMGCAYSLAFRPRRRAR